jgi:probable rRNA maturation factor
LEKLLSDADVDDRIIYRMFEVSSTIQKKPRINTRAFLSIKDSILGKKHEVSLTFIGSKRAQTLNIKHRQKDYIPNILTFALDDTYTEIFICPDVAKKQRKDFDLSLADYYAFLFIHGCLHAQGLPHGDEMDTQEEKYLKKYQKMAK